MQGVTVVAPLLNYEGPAPLTLNENTEIHKIREHVRHLILEAERVRFVRHPAEYKFCLIARNVVIRDDLGDESRKVIEEAILRLRLFQTGGIGFNFGFADPDGWYDAPRANAVGNIAVFGVFFYFVWGREGMTSAYHLQADDVEGLRTLFADTRGQMLMDKPAFRYFFRAYHEPYAMDRFLSNAIALENLLANDHSDWSNIRYKFADRGCFLLQKAHPEEDANSYNKPLKDIYDARSKIVQARSTSEHDWSSAEDLAILRNSEDYLRQLLRYVPYHPEMERSVNVDKAKRAHYRDGMPP